MYHFHAMIHARPTVVEATGEFAVDGLCLQSVLRPTAAASRPFAVRFEETGTALQALPRMFFELDGSFVWVGAGPPAWQLDGLLYDRDERLLFAEIKGCCPAAEFDQLLTTLGWPDMPVLFQLTQSALFVEESEFRRWAAHNRSA